MGRKDWDTNFKKHLDRMHQITLFR